MRDKDVVWLRRTALGENKAVSRERFQPICSVRRGDSDRLWMVVVVVMVRRSVLGGKREVEYFDMPLFGSCEEDRLSVKSKLWEEKKPSKMVQ